MFHVLIKDTRGSLDQEEQVTYCAEGSIFTPFDLKFDFSNSIPWAALEFRV